jgi:hypothetical protein
MLLRKVSCGHASDIHLQDLSRMPQEFVQVDDAVGDLIGSAGEHHAAFQISLTPRRSTHRPADFG